MLRKLRRKKVLNDKPVLIDVKSVFDGEEAEKERIILRAVITLKSQKDIVSGAESELS
jgi:hypothetical protein